MALNPQQKQFVEEYIIDLNATQAAKRAGYSAATAYSQGQRLLKHVEVAASLSQAMAERAERTTITQDRVVQELWAIATADPGELVEWRRVCCRHCWGDGFRYQHTPFEMETRRAEYEAASPKPTLEFDPQGGDGFNRTLDPNPACPECVGEGSGEPFFKDTRLLSDEGRRLYAGVKVTKEGIEIKMHDRTAALLNVGKHLGMFRDSDAPGSGAALVVYNSPSAED